MRPLPDGQNRAALNPQRDAIKSVTSRQNAFVEALRDIRDDAAGPLLFLEGPRLLEEALKSQLLIERVAFVPALGDLPIVRAACAKAKEKVQITPYVLEGLSDVKTPQGVIAIARKPKTEWGRIVSRAPRPIVILDGIQNAGNAATIVRTAEAAGVAGILTTPGTARLFSPKALRGAMGSSLRVPILEHQLPETLINDLADAGYGLLAASSPQSDSRSFNDVEWRKSWAIVLGQEGHGLSAVWQKAQATLVHIPMEPAVESLNVAAAAALLLYEARRVR